MEQNTVWCVAVMVTVHEEVDVEVEDAFDFDVSVGSGLSGFLDDFFSSSSSSFSLSSLSPPPSLSGALSGGQLPIFKPKS